MLRQNTPFIAYLPVWLLAGMVLIGLVLESAVYGVLLWAAKLPLVLLVAALGWRLARRPSRPAG